MVSGRFLVGKTETILVQMIPHTDIMVIKEVIKPAPHIEGGNLWRIGFRQLFRDGKKVMDTSGNGIGRSENILPRVG